MKMTLFGGLLAGASMISASAQATETVTAVHAFPETLIYTKSFLEFVGKVNAAGEGVGQALRQREGQHRDRVSPTQPRAEHGGRGAQHVARRIAGREDDLGTLGDQLAHDALGGAAKLGGRWLPSL